MAQRPLLKLALLTLLTVPLLTACGEPAQDPPEIELDAGTSADVCMAPKTTCSGKCVNLADNVNHCGACGNACGAGGFYCSEGACKCIKAGAANCGGKCITLKSNNDHCGACGNSCASGQKCEEGQCRTLSQIEKVIKETNDVRAMGYDCGKYGTKPSVGPVEGNAELHEAAQMHAERMAELNFFAHDDPHDGSDFVERIGRTDYSARPGGENIAKGQDTAAQVVKGWAESDGHCKNMLNGTFNEMGVGYTVSQQGVEYWVQVFGVRR
jgi:uncharacterized protein YkwD